MKDKKLFDKYYSRLATEGIIKAILCGLIVGFAVDFIIAFATWFTAFNGLWLAIGCGALAAVVSAVIFYFSLFRPTTEKVAKCVDRLGLEERLVTMIELENDDSYIAMRQREDAKEKLAAVDAKKVRIAVSAAMIVAVCLLCAGGIAMTTVTGLAAEGVIEGGDEFVDSIIPPSPEDYIAVSYLAGEGGSISGEADQLILKGEATTPVIAVPEDGYAFVQWSDGFAEPTRSDADLDEDTEFEAVFQPVQEGDGEGDGDGEGQEGEGDSDQQAPGQEGQGEGEGEGQEGQGEGEGEGNKPNRDPSQGNGAGGKYDDNNSIIDGETYYRDKYEEYYDRAMDAIESGDDIPSDLKDFIEKYFDIIE